MPLVVILETTKKYFCLQLSSFYLLKNHSTPILGIKMIFSSKVGLWPVDWPKMEDFKLFYLIILNIDLSAWFRFFRRLFSTRFWCSDIFSLISFSALLICSSSAKFGIFNVYWNPFDLHGFYLVQTLQEVVLHELYMLS